MPDIFIDHSSRRTAQQPNHPHGTKQKLTRQPTPDPNSAIKTHKLSIFSTFVRQPYGIALAEQYEDEHIILFIRRAFITNIPWMIIAFLLLFTPFFIIYLLGLLPLPVYLLTTETRILLIMFYYLLVLGYILASFVTWFYDMGIVTEKRAVDVDFYNYSFVSVATARVHDLIDVRYVQKGFFESFFDYGDVTLVVAASGETLTFEYTPNPAEVVSILSVLIGGYNR